MPLERDSDIAALLSGARCIALIGASPKPERAAHGVMRYLVAQGYAVAPVNPLYAGTEIAGQPVVGSLTEIATPIDIVDIFRRAEEAGEAVDAAIASGARAVWLQLGVVDHDAAARAEAAGLAVVMDRCIKIEHARLGIAPRS